MRREEIVIVMEGWRKGDREEDAGGAVGRRKGEGGGDRDGRK